MLDLGCGTGILAAALSVAGYEIVGIDVSEEMLALARRTAADARYVRDTIWTVELPHCRAVLSVGEGLNYLPATAPLNRCRTKL